LDRRQFMQGLVATTAGLTPASNGFAATAPLLTRPIPKSGEAIPIIGMGTWITLNVGDDPDLRADRLNLIRSFFDDGGRMIDSSPMYGSSEEVIGW